MSDTKPPARPTRRFSAIKPRVKRAKAAAPATVDAQDLIDAPGPIDAPRPMEAAAPPAAGPRGTAPASSQPASQKASDEARIAKVMARAGLCSRRDAEAWILDGRVAVNGAVITSPALNVGAADAVTVDGYPIDKPERTRLFLFHKTRGLVTTSRDPEGRPTVFDALPPELPRLMTIGRLDINTEGLLLLTNDGGLARLLELPATGWIRRYRVRANGTTDQAKLDALAKGITIDGVVYAGIAAKLDRVQGANLWLTMGLKEGKNREIKRVLEHLGLAVTRLIRISFGPFQLGELGDNAVEEVRTRVLRDQLGTALAKQAGIDFDGPADADPPPAPASGDRPGKSGPAKAADGARGRQAVVEEAPRRQTRRTSTADRRGRPVAVERITTSRPERGGERPRTLRQADRPAREPDDASARSAAARSPTGRPPRGTGRGAPQRAERSTEPAAWSLEAPRLARPRDRDERSGRDDRRPAKTAPFDAPRPRGARPDEARGETPAARTRAGKPHPGRAAAGKAETPRGAPRQDRRDAGATAGASRPWAGKGAPRPGGSGGDRPRGGAGGPGRGPGTGRPGGKGGGKGGGQGGGQGGGKGGGKGSGGPGRPRG